MTRQVRRERGKPKHWILELENDRFFFGWNRDSLFWTASLLAWVTVCRCRESWEDLISFIEFWHALIWLFHSVFNVILSFTLLYGCFAAVIEEEEKTWNLLKLSLSFPFYLSVISTERRKCIFCSMSTEELSEEQLSWAWAHLLPNLLSGHFQMPKQLGLAYIYEYI